MRTTTDVSWLRHELGVPEHALETLKARLAECDTCRHYRYGLCHLFQGIDRRIKHAQHLLAGECAWHTERTRWYVQCQTCEHLRADGRCQQFLAGCDAEQRRAAVLRSGNCRYYRPIERLTDSYHGPAIQADRFITTARLAAYTMELARHIPLARFRAIIGVARSGLIPASIIATIAHLPLWAVSPTSVGVEYVGNGYRLAAQVTGLQTPALIVDDTVSAGGTLEAVKNNLRSYVDQRKLATAAILAAPEVADKVDFVVRIYPRPHYLEWCFANTFYAQYLAFDMDGIICDDPPGPDTDPLYDEHLKHAAPLYVPRMWPATIITARCESTRRDTEEWLKRHGITVRQLIMWAGDPDARWKAYDTVAAWKAEHLKRLRRELAITAYVESAPHIAMMISETARLPVVCPVAERVFGSEYWQSQCRTS
jgi:hypoxanthine phosphoribosyltransferase